MIIIVNLKPEYLIDTEESISMNYGEKLPDKWNILGIVDYKEEVTDDDAKNPLIDLLHQTKEMRHLLGISNNQGTVIPLLIYRELNIPSPV